jgi:hypothetical protein
MVAGETPREAISRAPPRQAVAELGRVLDPVAEDVGHLVADLNVWKPIKELEQCASSLSSIGAPKNTPAEIVDKLNNEINASLADPRLAARFAGATVLAGSPADFGKLMALETEKWAKVIKFAGIKAE